MPHIYHMVPTKMVGSELIPLEELARDHSKVHDREIKKYDDHPRRKLLPKQMIKKLNCPRENVLHFAPIHPNLLFKGLKSVFPDNNRSVFFYKIPIERIWGLPAVIFDMNRLGKYIFGAEEPEEMFEWVTPESYREWTMLPSAALEFYQQWKDRGENDAPAFGCVPHLFVQGRVNIEGCEIINWTGSVS